METLRRYMYEVRLYAFALVKWLALAAVTGVLCGLIGSCFAIAVSHATMLREKNAWLIFLLSFAGVIIAWVYRIMHTEGQGTDDIIDAVHLGKPISAKLLPSIFIGTVLTHLTGGSAGREGAALQMGGTIGYFASRLLRLDDRDRRTATLCGMAAFFSALFGTPLTATVFAMMAISVGELYHAAFIPGFTASLVAYGISLWLGVEPVRFAVAVPALEIGLLLRVALLAALCGWVSSGFCAALHFAGHKAKKLFPNAYLRAFVGGLIVIALTLLVGTRDYNGAGMGVITAAVEEGRARPEAFILKILFTAVTLAAGFKGGEVVPCFFIGATFGCAVAPLVGLSAPFGAALGLVSVFCGATNCPVASIFLSIELFGGQGLLYFALACGVSYMLSGYSGLYSSQTILYSKLKAQYINVHTNAHHAADFNETHPDVNGSVKD